MHNSIRLLLAALAVSGITFAASGKPLHFLAKAHAPASNPILLPPGGAEGPAPGEILVLERTGHLIRT